MGYIILFLIYKELEKIINIKNVYYYVILILYIISVLKTKSYYNSGI